MANVQAFNPQEDATQNINVGASSTQTGSALFNAGGYRQVRVFNDGTATVWIKFGDATVSADTSNDIPIGPGRDVIFTVPNEQGGTWAAAIAAAATGRVYFTPGSGL